MPPKKDRVPRPVDGRCDDNAIVTAIVPGPVVSGIVSGKKATSSSDSCTGAATVALRSSCTAGCISRPQARMATTRPPAILSAPRLIPKKFST
jgi:hypothetical protein